MRIISKFKDYYDGGSAYGVDTDYCYVRTTTALDYVRYSGWGYFEVIGFCGQIYPLINYSEKISSNKWKRHPKDYVLYQKEALEYDFEARTNKQTGEKEFYKEKVLDDHLHSWGGKWFWNKSKTDYYNDLVNSQKLKELFFKHKIPVFHIGPETPFYKKRTRPKKLVLTLNPCLKDYAFYKVQDTVQTFQQIFQFISTNLVEEQQGKGTTGDDEVVGKSKGFDRYSFRSAKKKPKKW